MYNVRRAKVYQTASSQNESTTNNCHLTLPESLRPEEKMITPYPWHDLMLPEDEEMILLESYMPPETGSCLVLPERGMDPYAAGSKEDRTKWGSEKPDKERIRSMLENLDLDEAEKNRMFSVVDAIPKVLLGGGGEEPASG